MQVDSFRFLPRSFRAAYDDPPRLPGEEDVVWAPFEPRLADARVTLLTSAGLFLRADQQPFDVERERREPTWGDPGWRAVPHACSDSDLGITHLHINPDDVRADHNVALPTDVLQELVDEGRVGGATADHVSVMGYQQAGLDGWRNETGPQLVDHLRSQRCDGVVLAPV